VQLVPVGNGRALISLSSETSISSLELQVRDALERLGPENREREGLRSLADILRRSRGSRGLASEARTIIVLAPKAQAAGQLNRPALARHLPASVPSSKAPAGLRSQAAGTSRSADARRRTYVRRGTLQHVSERKTLEMRANADELEAGVFEELSNGHAGEVEEVARRGETPTSVP
jgi:hypothetical protein